MKIVKDMIQRQSNLKAWFEHANRYAGYETKYKEGFKREFDELMEMGKQLSQIPEINGLDLLCDITDGSPQNERLAITLKKDWLIHLDDDVIGYDLRFFKFLYDNDVISFVEYSEASRLSHVLNWRMIDNSNVAKQALKDAGFYDNEPSDTAQNRKQPESEANYLGKVEVKTPALDFIFFLKMELRNKFIAFFKSEHKNLKLTATDVVQILFLALGGRARFDALNKNGMSAKFLWSDLRSVNVVGGDVVANVTDRTLNIAAKRNAKLKPEVKVAWEAFNK